MTQSRVSFIIPVLNDARRLAMCLQSIRRTLAAQGLVEIVVVDNGSTDGSADVARRLGATVIVAEQGRVSTLRNLGAARAIGDILAFVDADHEIAAGWVMAALDTLGQPDAGAAGALCQPPLDGTWVQRAYGYLRGRPRGRRDVEWLGSGNLAVWRHVFDQLRGFDASLEACEDVELCGRIRAAGYRVISDARLDNVHHGDPRTLVALFRSELWRGRDNLRVSLRGPITWRSLPSTVVPIIDLAMVAIVLAGVIAGAAGYAPGLLAAAGATAVILAGALAKVVRARLRDSTWRAAGLLQVLVVACVYDCARALALLVRTPHRGAVRSTVPAVP